MKHLPAYVTFLLATLLLPACYKDLSTPATTTLSDIVISGLDEDDYYVLYGHTLSLKAKVWEDGREDSEFTYRWEMDLRPGSGADRLLIGEGLALEYKVGNTPSDTPYTLSFTARDEVTGVEAIRIMRVFVTSSLGRASWSPIPVTEVRRRSLTLSPTVSLPMALKAIPPAIPAIFTRLPMRSPSRAG